MLGITCRNRSHKETFFPYCLLITLTRSNSHVIVLPESIFTTDKLQPFSKPQRPNPNEPKPMDADLALD